MGTAYPEQGGLYAWIRDAFGKRWATRATWLYWINLPIWSASVFVMFSAILAQLFWPGLGRAGQIVLAIAMNWLGNRLFSFKRTGINGFLKRRMLPDKGAGKAVAEDEAVK